MMIFNGEEVLPFFGEAVGCFFRDLTKLSWRQVQILHGRLMAHIDHPAAQLPFRPASTILGRK